jgi:TolB-like protein/AraC-like DNA-binding protein
MAEPIAVDQVFIRKLTERILANLENKNFGVMELAHESGMSIYSLNRRLHSINKKTGTQFIREVRLQKALEMLQSGEVTASQVAYKVGFSSPAYFSTCFHEYFGYPPGKVKKESLKNHKANFRTVVTPDQELKRPAWRTFVLASSGILLLSVLIYAVYSVSAKHFNADGGNPVINREKSIAVLPFKNLGNSMADQYFIDGVMDEIFINLSKIHDLRVVSRTSVEQFRNTEKSIPEIAKKLNVNFIVEGRGQKYGGTFRLRVQLIEGSADKQIWAGSYEQEIYETKDIFKIQNQVAQTIASALNATITLEEQELINRIPTANLTAYDLYMKASGYQKEYRETRNLSTYTKAITFYKAALELDSSFARAYSDLASLYLTRYYWETYFKEDFLDSCLVLANLALSYDGQMDEAYFIIGRCYFEKGNIEEALVNYDKSLEIYPDYSDAHAYKGYLFTSLINDYVWGIDSYQKAVNTGPPEYRPDLLRGLGQAYLDVGFIEKARSCYRQAFELDGNKGLYLFKLSDIEYCLENYEEAIKLGNEAGEVDSTYFPETSYYYGPVEHNTEAYLQANKLLKRFTRSGELNLNQAHRVGYAFWKMGKYDEAKSFFNQQIRYSLESIKLKRRMAEYRGAYYDLAATYAFLGDKDKAYQYLGEFNKKKFYPLYWLTLAKHDPLFNNIRKEERFQAILKNMESKYQAEHERVKKWMEENGTL